MPISLAASRPRPGIPTTAAQEPLAVDVASGVIRSAVDPVHGDGGAPRQPTRRQQGGEVGAHRQHSPDCAVLGSGGYCAGCADRAGELTFDQRR
ncbi:MAG: hypothetical protein ACRDQ5_09340 [Sciscionella sp.]